ncbi:MAG: cytochrome b/b6 domain-containing protein [Burkholderiaceae bacterium]|nr:cytochrome b/b6 domain-containing protein [Burkholderiaceae bacterium]
MHTAPAFQPAVAGPSGTPAARRRRVIDAPTRMFHWLFALSFVGASLTAAGERWRALPGTLGSALAGLFALRVLYGLVGPRQARLVPMVRRLRAAPAWLRSFAQALRDCSVQGVNWRQGQNLLMAFAVVALFAMVVPLTLSGYGTYDDWGDFLGGDWLEDVHEFFAEVFLVIVLGHVAMIALLSVSRRRNQALPMLSGHIDGSGPDIVKRNHAWLAVLLLIAVIVFVGWQWQQSPNGLIPAKGSTQSWSDRRHHHDD